MSDSVTYLVVDRTDPHKIDLRTEPRQALADGQVRFRVDEFAFTANSVTYMVAGDMLGYWDFFPVDLPWGRSPVMGHAEIVESAHPEIVVGGRYFGWFPIATEVVIDANPSGTGVRDDGAHRANHAPVYRAFEAADDPAGEDKRALLRGLFTTSFLADDFLADNGDFGAQQTIVLSASSKTGIAMGWCLKARGHRAIGATSEGNRAFVEQVGCWDEVVTYDELSGLDGSVPTNLVDMSGRSEAVHAVHTTFETTLGHSMLIGMTHWDAPRSDEPLPGPAPAMFFAPTQVEKRNADWGRDGFAERVGASWLEFAAWSDSWLTVRRQRGLAEAVGAYHEMIDGDVAPSEGLILSLHA